MGSKTPPIQVLIEDFATDHKKSLVYIEEYDCYYLFNEKRKFFEPLSKDKITKMLALYLRPLVESSISQNTISTALMWLKIYTHKKISTIDDRYAIFKDKTVINLHTLETKEYEKDDIIFYYIPCNYPKKTDKCPNFLKFLSQILVDQKKETNQELIRLVQEMFGYYFLTTQEPPVAFFLVGEGANGKSTLLFVLEQIVGGQQFIMSNSLENLTTKDFHVQELRFKRLNICSEEQSKFIKPGNFKTMTEGTLMHAEIKFGDQISFRPRTKHVFASNQMPSIENFDYASKRRVKIVPLYRKFLPHETDKTLKTKDFKDSKFAPELAGIVGWAIEGAKRLMANNYDFSESKLVSDEMKEYESAVSSTVNFWRDNFIKCKKDERDATFYSIKRLYRIYSYWCRTANNRKAVQDIVFRRQLKTELRLRNFGVGRDSQYGTSSRGIYAKATGDSIVRETSFQSYFGVEKEVMAQEESSEPNF